MAITTFDGYIAAAKQYVPYIKTPGRVTVAAAWFTPFDLAGNPGAGTLAGTSTTAGVVPTATDAGFPPINAFGGSNTGYLSQVQFASTAACRIKVFDLVWKGGAYAFTAGTTTLSAQPSYSARVPGGTDYTGTQIWIEVSTAFVTGTAWQVQVTYTNQAGTAGRTGIILPATSAAGLTLGRMYQLGLQAGDSGVQKIESVIVTNGVTAMTAGNFNVLVMRPLWSGRVPLNNGADIHDLTKTGMSQVFATSALYPIFNCDSTALGVPEMEMVIANG